MIADGHRQLTGDDHHLVNLLILPAVHAGGAQGEPDLGRSAPHDRAEAPHARTDRARVVARPGAVDRPDPGVDEAGRLGEDVGAADVELTSEDLAEIDGAASEIRVEGGSYTENLEQMTGR
jgi:hypothetical protein